MYDRCSFVPAAALPKERHGLLGGGVGLQQPVQSAALAGGAAQREPSAATTERAASPTTHSRILPTQWLLCFTLLCAEPIDNMTHLAYDNIPMNKQFSFSISGQRVAVLALLISGCTSDPVSGATPDTKECLADAIQLTETELTLAANSVILDFDVKNTSSTDYDIEAGSNPVELAFTVTTTDGTKYESQAPLTASKIGAGANSTAIAQAKFGAGKTYQSYTFTRSCRD